MSSLINSGVLNIAFLGAMLATPVLALLVWFFVNRASVRANEQIELLEALLEQQRQQNALLLRLCKANEPDMPEDHAAQQAEAEPDPLIQLVAER